MGDFQNTGYHLDRDWIAREEYGIDHDKRTIVKRLPFIVLIKISFHMR
jgi:hypothetical protein